MMASWRDNPPDVSTFEDRRSNQPRRLPQPVACDLCGELGERPARGGGFVPFADEAEAVDHGWARTRNHGLVCEDCAAHLTSEGWWNA